MTTTTIERQIVERTVVNLPELKRTPCLQCDDGYLSSDEVGKQLCPACFGATYVIEKAGQ